MDWVVLCVLGFLLIYPIVAWAFWRRFGAAWGGVVLVIMALEIVSTLLLADKTSGLAGDGEALMAASGLICGVLLVLWRVLERRLAKGMGKLGVPPPAGA